MTSGGREPRLATFALLGVAPAGVSFDGATSVLTVAAAPAQQIDLHGKPRFQVDDTSAALAGDLKLNFPQIEYVARLSNAGFPPAIRRGDVSMSEPGAANVDPDFFKVLPMPAVAGTDSVQGARPPQACALPETARARVRPRWSRNIP